MERHAGSVGVDTSTFFVFAGNKSVVLDGDNGGPDSLTQTLATTAGQLLHDQPLGERRRAECVLPHIQGTKVAGAPTTVSAITR